MKTFNKIFLTLGVVASTLGLSSCVGDLDMMPIDPNEITDVSGNMDQVFSAIYLNFATSGANGGSPVQTMDDAGMATWYRALYTAEEFPTDEGCWLWDPEKFGRINYGYVTPDIPAVQGFYARLIINVALCNDFITAVNEGRFTLDDAGQKRAEEYVRQARVLRGICNFYLLSFYENPPYADETTPIGSDPIQPGRAQVYSYVTSDLEDVVAEYKAIDPAQKPSYGFVGLDVAESYLAKLYLNGMVFAGRDDYAKCYEHSKAVIDRLGHGGKYGNGLAPTYISLFGYNNYRYAIGNNEDAVNEIIWTLPARKEYVNGELVEDLSSWGSSTFLIAAWNGTSGTQVTVPTPTNDRQYANLPASQLLFEDENGVRHIYQYYAEPEYTSMKQEYDAAMGSAKESWKYNVDEFVNDIAYAFDPDASGHLAGNWFNTPEGWRCMVTRKSFVRKFDWKDVEMSKSDDMRTAFWQTSAHGFTVENVSLVGDEWGSNGYLAMKYTNWVFDANGNIDFEASNHIYNQGGTTGGDVAALRLAEVYLMAAEAILQGGGGSQAEAVKYVNYIRERAFGAAYTPWSSVSMSELQDERCRELYSENSRRTDLIRWNLWCTGYTWEWKGGIQSGMNLPEYTKSYPIPSGVMSTTNLQQQTGY